MRIAQFSCQVTSADETADEPAHHVAEYELEGEIMPSGLGPINICCDAPPYPIIEACKRIGLERPEDVRWCRMRHFMNGEDGHGELVNVQAWKAFFKIHKRAITCDCGQNLPTLEKCTFTFITGRELSYAIGQCQRCLTVFWEEEP